MFSMAVAAGLAVVFSGASEVLCATSAASSGAMGPRMAVTVWSVAVTVTRDQNIILVR